MLVKLILCAAAAAATIEWRGITAKIKDRDILRGVGGEAKAGRLHAIMGPSGSGKTSLLSALSGTCDRRLKLSGDLRADGVAVDKVEGAYVRQQDVFYPYLTVRETLTFAATLRLGADADVPKTVDTILMKTGLAKAADTIVGDDKIRGVSGGERKRLAIACELVDDPDVLFLDEPTSGLDPQTAQDIVGLVRQLADDGRIVFLVTHDVTPSILAMVDHLMVLAPGGRLAWFGPPRDSCDWFEVDSPDAVFARLPEHPPETWGTRFKEGNAFKKFVRTREHLLGLDGVRIERGAASNERVQHSMWSQFVTLTRRYAKVKLRDSAGLAILLAQAPVLGLFMYIVFPVGRVVFEHA